MFSSDNSENVTGIELTGFGNRGNSTVRHNLWNPAANRSQGGVVVKKPNAAGTTVEVYNNVFMGVGGANAVRGTGRQIHTHHNLILGGWRGHNLDWDGTQAHDSAAVVEYNTMVSSGSHAVQNNAAGGHSGIDATFRRNLVELTGASGRVIRIAQTVSNLDTFNLYARTFTIDQNCYITSAALDIEFFGAVADSGWDGGFAGWQALKWDTLSLNTDPNWVSDTQDLTGDYTPQTAGCADWGVYGDSVLAQFPAPGTLTTSIGRQVDPLQATIYRGGGRGKFRPGWLRRR